MKTDEKVLADIDWTLDQLIQNAKIIQSVSLKELDLFEIEALQKTQESLLARLLHTNISKKVQADPKSINVKRKIRRYSRLNARLVKKIENKWT
ncbi:MAG: hypothetical protein L0207_06420 [Chlamydiae bacterium]|nr:hypothetical protein [Chlamydiota bacterium]